MNEKRLKKILTLFVEESAEVIKEICKIDHHGIDSYNPVTGVANVDALHTELVDLLVIIELLNEEVPITNDGYNSMRGVKLEKLKKWHPDLFD